MSVSESSIKVPFFTKLKVWWEGYDMREVEARLKERQPKPTKAAAPKPDVTPMDTVLPIPPWDDKRIEIAQYIWGEGYCGPGGPDQVIALSKLLAMSPEMSALVIGAGLGGPSRVLAQEFGVWITGVEENEKLATAAMELSSRAGLAKKAEIKHYDPKNPDLERNFDRAFSKEALFTVEAKLDLLRHVHQKLKPDSLFLMTDYFLARDGVTNTPDYVMWKQGEAIRPYPVTITEMQEILDVAGFSIRVNEDVTETYVAMVARAWADADKVVSKLLEQGEQGRVLVDVLMREAEYWSLRCRLLEHGMLHVHRILVSKKSGKTMSDW